MLTDALEGLQEAMLIAKPRDFFNFAIRYIHDDRPEHHHHPTATSTTATNVNANNSHYTSEELHYIHILPYLINNMKEFQAKGKLEK